MTDVPQHLIYININNEELLHVLNGKAILEYYLKKYYNGNATRMTITLFSNTT